MVSESTTVHGPLKIGIGIQARLSSTRFPRKIFQKVEGKTSLLQSCLNQAFYLKKLLEARGHEATIALLSPFEDGEEIENHLKDFEHKPRIILGDRDNVFSRYQMFHQFLKPRYLFRITSDCPYWSALLADRLLSEMMLRQSDFGWIQTPNPFPDGLDVEVIRGDLMDRMIAGPRHVGIDEHVTIGLKSGWIVKPEKEYRLPKDDNYVAFEKLSIDSPSDLQLVKEQRERIWWIPNSEKKT